MIEIAIPFPLSVNHIHIDRVVIPAGWVRGDRTTPQPFVTRFLSKEAEQWKAQVSTMIKKLGHLPMKGDVRLHCILCVKDRVRRDCSNFSKLLEDTITDSGLFNDDSQIVDGTYSKRLSPDKKHFAVLKLKELETSVFGVAERKVAKKRSKRKVAAKKKKPLTLF